MNAIGDAANPWRKRNQSQERKQVVNQYLYLQFPTQSM